MISLKLSGWSLFQNNKFIEETHRIVWSYQPWIGHIRCFYPYCLPRRLFCCRQHSLPKVQTGYITTCLSTKFSDLWFAITTKINPYRWRLKSFRWAPCGPRYFMLHFCGFGENLASGASALHCHRSKHSHSAFQNKKEQQKSIKTRNNQLKKSTVLNRLLQSAFTVAPTCVDKHLPLRFTSSNSLREIFGKYIGR